MIRPADLSTVRSLRDELSRLAPEQRRAFALACARHSLDILPDDLRAPVLRAALNRPAPDAVSRYARWQTVTRHLWASGGCGSARRILWLMCYWALWPADPFTTYAADQTAWHARWACAEATVTGPGPIPASFFTVERAEERWQRSLLTSLIVPAPLESGGHR